MYTQYIYSYDIYDELAMDESTTVRQKLLHLCICSILFEYGKPLVAANVLFIAAKRVTMTMYT